MIDKPRIGMRVVVENPDNCCVLPGSINHPGYGVITEISDTDSFLVRMDPHPDEWWLCRRCVSVAGPDGSHAS